jgi:lipopolysaccharide/colanic/teichoic acid biosynthesis glycosyltransferase
MTDLIPMPGVRRAVTSPIDGLRWSATTLPFDGRPQTVFDEIRSLIGVGWVEEIVVLGEDRAEVLHWVVAAARLAGRRLRLAATISPTALPAAQGREHWLKDGDSWILVPPARPRLKLAIKRMIDIVAASALLILLSPILLAIAIAVQLTSGWPILYAWRVLGENGRPFVGYKFRTMVRGADELKPQLMHLNERSGPVFKMARDPRVTSFGGWLRKYSLDELPQLWSVLVGDMSLVGPRPVFSSEYLQCELWQMRKLTVKPGLTCLWQVDGRQTITDFSDWARLDLRYIDTWSLWNDAVIFLRTPLAIIRGTGH